MGDDTRDQPSTRAARGRGREGVGDQSAPTLRVTNGLRNLHPKDGGANLEETKCGFIGNARPDP